MREEAGHHAAADQLHPGPVAAPPFDSYTEVPASTTCEQQGIMEVPQVRTGAVKGHARLHSPSAAFIATNDYKIRYENLQKSLYPDDLGYCDPVPRRMRTQKPIK